jgi:hypothetical protein
MCTVLLPPGDNPIAVNRCIKSNQTKPVLLLSNEHGSQVKDQGQRQCCHNKHKNFPIGLHVVYLYFPDTPPIYPCLKASDKVQIITTAQNDDCDSSVKDFNGFYDQKVGHSALAHISVVAVNFGFKPE